MQAELLLEEHHVSSEAVFVESVIWRVPIPVHGSPKNSVALVVDGDCVLRYDNETGEGDHPHVRGKEHKSGGQPASRETARPGCVSR